MTLLHNTHSVLVQILAPAKKMTEARLIYSFSMSACLRTMWVQYRPRRDGGVGSPELQSQKAVNTVFEGVRAVCGGAGALQRRKAGRVG